MIEESTDESENSYEKDIGKESDSESEKASCSEEYSS